MQGRYLVFAVNKVNPANLAEIQPEQKKAFTDQLNQIDGMAAAKAYIDAMRKHYKVQTEEANL